MTDKELRYHKFFIESAKITASLSFAKRTKVGAILVKDGRIICNGFNGTPSGCDNECETVQPDGTLVTNDNVIHAEANAIYFCARRGIATNGADLYITLSPCEKCALAIIQAGIKHVYYLDEYRDTAGLRLLKEAGIETTKLTVDNDNR